MLAASGSSITPMIRGPRRSFEILGTARAALYLRSGADVVAVLTADAVRLPCSVVLADPVSLHDVAPDADVTVEAGTLRWTSRGRPLIVEVVREWPPARVRPVAPRVDRLAELRTGISAIDIDVPTDDPFSVVGRGPGLTPSGDDVLAGYLLGCRAFGLPIPALPDLTRTTALSAALLRYAAAGLCIPELAALVRSLGGASPLDPTPLLSVGHTSGAALAAGLLRALPRWRSQISVPNLAAAAGEAVA